MRRRQVIVGCILLATIATWCLTDPFHHEPSYKGKSLTYWLRGYRAGNYQWNSSTPESANEAVRSIGTNGIPTLLKMLVAKDSALDIKLLRWSYRWRGWAGKIRFLKIAPIPHLNSYDAIEAASAFRELGPKAVVAVPDLTKLLGRDLPPGQHSDVVFSLISIGPAAKGAAPALLKDLRASDPNVRGNALFALSQIRAEPELVVTNATLALSDPNPYVRTHAVNALKLYATEAKSAVPALLDAIQRWSLQPVSSQTPFANLNDPAVAAQEALKMIDPEAAAKAGIK